MYVVKLIEKCQPRGMPYEKGIERTLTLCYSKRNGFNAYYTDDSNSNTRAGARYPDDEKKVSVKFDYVKDEEDSQDSDRPRDGRRRGSRNRNRGSDYDRDSMDRRSSRGNERNRIRDVDHSQNLLPYHDDPVGYNHNQNPHFDNNFTAEPLSYHNEPMRYLEPVNEDNNSRFRGRDDVLELEPINYTADSAYPAYPLVPIEDRNSRFPGREDTFIPEHDSHTNEPVYLPRSPPTTESRGSMSRANTYPLPFPPPKQVRFSQDVDRYPNTSRRRSRRDDDERPSPSRRRSTR